MECSHKKAGFNPAKKIAFGLTVVSAGVLLLLFNLGHINNEYKSIVFSWQSLLVALGFINLFSKENWYTGIILLTIGGLFLAPMIIDVSFSIVDIVLPVGIILLGIFISIKKFTPSKHRLKQKIHDVFTEQKEKYCNHENSSDKGIEDINIFSGGRKVITDQYFCGGTVINIFGGLELDLRQTNLKDTVTVIESINIFGGLSLIVPSDWEIKTETVSILGGYADKRSDIVISETNKKLVIKGVNLFGGGEFKTSVWVKG